jgi:hypothetical protein
MSKETEPKDTSERKRRIWRLKSATHRLFNNAILWIIICLPVAYGSLFLIESCYWCLKQATGKQTPY